jgi:PAT family beta-lactamase induction signal transducer AmpG
MTRNRLLLLAGVLYFAEGLPFGIVNELAPLYLRASGVSLTAIGLLSTVSLAWTAKFLWAPLVDSTRSYRPWIFGSLAVIATALAAIAFTPGNLSIFWIAVVAIAVASATQDIGIDATTVVLTPREHLGPVNAARVTFYRGALIATGGAMAVVGSRFGWRAAFLLAAGVAAALALFALTIPDTARRKVEHRDGLLAPLRRWMGRPGFGLALAAVLLYRLGDAALLPMIKPFWLDRGYSAGEVGTITSTFGIAFMIAGAICGGWIVARLGVFRSLLLLGIGQMASNVFYAAVTAVEPTRPIFYTATAFENFSGGLGTAAFLALLMALCDKEHAATEYALLTAVYGLSRSLIGGSSGILTERFGYSGFFWLTVALSIPGIVIAWRLGADGPSLSDPEERPAVAGIAS